MKNLKSYIVIILFLSVMLSADEIKNTAISYEYYITTPDSESAVKHLISQTKNMGGLIIFYDNNRVIFRIPVSKVENIKTELKTTGYISDEKIDMNDFSESLITLESNLKVKNEYLMKLYGVTNTAELSGLLDAETAIDSAVSEIENIKGSIKYIRYITVNPIITVNIYNSSNVPVNYRKKSRYEWINQLTIENLFSGGVN